MTFRDEGIVLKKNNLAEADQILTILTQEHGKISCVANGIRRIKSRKGGNADLFTLSKFSFAEGKNLDILLQAETINPFMKIKEDLKSIALLFYISEVIDKLVTGVDPHEDIYTLVKNTFIYLNKGSDEDILLRYFELQILALSGYEPQLSHCAVCGRKLIEGEELVFTEHGVVHRECHVLNREYGSRFNIGISEREIKVMSYLLRSTIEEALKLKGAKNILDKIKVLTKHVLQDTIGSRINSYKFLEDV